MTVEKNDEYWREYKRQWSRRRRAALRAKGLNAHGKQFVASPTDTRRQVRS